jgi:hypothetical protein
MTDSQRKAMEWAKDIYRNKSGSTDGLIADIAAALDAARAEALEEAAKACDAAGWSMERAPGVIARASNVIRALSSEAPAAREGGERG